MRKWIGVICVFLGVVCILSSVGFVVYNRWEDESAEEFSRSLLKDVQSIIKESGPKLPLPDDTVNLPDDAEKIPAEMSTVTVDGYDCIGILSVPALDLELPVLTDWSYAKLKKAPCLYYGTYYEKDFVIAAHNYQSHFGRLSELQTGDIVFFTDVNGVAHYYEVVLLETLPKEATKEMITGGFDLSLYTCTTGGSGRVTVRCNAVEDRSQKTVCFE
jgi:sortase A